MKHFDSQSFRRKSSECVISFFMCKILDWIMLYLIDKTQTLLKTDTVILQKRHIYQNSFTDIFKIFKNDSMIWKKKIFQTNIFEKKIHTLNNGGLNLQHRHRQIRCLIGCLLCYWTWSMIKKAEKGPHELYLHNNQEKNYYKRAWRSHLHKTGFNLRAMRAAQHSVVDV